MPTSFLDKVINWAIPLGVIIFLFFLFYSKFREAFDLMFEKIKIGTVKVFGALSGSGKKVAESSYEVAYTYGK